MKSNRIVTYQINGKFKAYYYTKGEKYFIKSNDLPVKFVKALMDKEKAKFFEIRKWIKLNYDNYIDESN